MKKRLSFQALFALSFFLLLSSASAGQLKSVKGIVEVQKKGASVWIQGRSKTKVSSGDTIRTSKKSKTEISLKDGHRILLSAESRLKVNSTKKNTHKFRLSLGRLRAFVSKLKSKAKFQVKTPVAVASVRGTIFDISVKKDQSSLLTVLEGRVAYKDLAGIGKEFIIPQGQSMIVKKGVGPEKARPAEELPQKEDGTRKKEDGSKKEDQEGEKTGESKKQKKTKTVKKIKNRDKNSDTTDSKKKTASKKQDPKKLTTSLFTKSETFFTFDLRTEIELETTLTIVKDLVQTEVAKELTDNQLQEGKALIDAFGNRVRIEEYITRPTINQFSYVAITERENRLDTYRYNLHAHRELPKDLTTVNLFESDEAMKNWAVGTELLINNGTQYYREWKDGGQPVKFELNKGTLHKVVFTDWFIEVLGNTKVGPVLLSHWVPEPSYLAGNINATLDRDLSDILRDAGQDVPSGYVDYLNISLRNLVHGNDRAIDDSGASTKARLNYFNDKEIKARYQASEGFDRTTVAYFNDKKIDLGSVNDPQEALNTALLTTSKLSLLHTYTTPGKTTLSLQQDTYITNVSLEVGDSGKLLSRKNLLSLGGKTENIYFENVFTSSLFGKGITIDALSNPNLNIQAGIERQ